MSLLVDTHSIDAPEKVLKQLLAFMLHGSADYWSRSLGTVLLEIGFWQPLRSFKTDLHRETFEEFTNRLVGLTKRELPGQVGKIYADAVKECLASTAYDSDADTQQRLCWKVIAALDQCVA